ncbi:MAG TPA: ABC transporter substrate-binding protein [Dehalococcoidia bacterium]|nr:ABC transporter substrate-binding protein [Dehalococcoidia bacterium]
MSDRYDADAYWPRLAGRRLNRRRLVQGGAAAAGVAALGLAGCSSNNNKRAATTAPAASTSAGTAAASATRAAASSSAATAAAAGTPGAAVLPTAQANLKTGGTIQGVIVGTANLDPVANTTYRSQWLAGFHYGRLFRFAAAADPQITLNRTPVPDLVQGYEVSPDGLTYTMKLRQGVNFQPPLSRALTSADVNASYQYFTGSAKNVNNGVYKPIVDSLTTPDDSTLVWKLKLPYAPFLNKLANPQYLWIMSKDAATDGKIDPSQQAIGVGPWIFAGATPTAFTWKKNPDYYLKGLPYADGAVLDIIPDSSTQEAQFQAGRIDVLGVQPADVDTMKKAVPKAHVDEYDPDGMSLLFFTNVSDASSPFKDVRVRQAASLAVDRQALIDAIYSGRGVWDNLINPGLGKWYLDPQGKEIGESAKWFKHDPQQAKQLIAAAGHADTQLKYIYPNNAYGDLYNATADAIRGMLADAGFRLQVVTVDYLKDWIDPAHGYAFQGLPPNSIGYALQTPFTDPDDFLTGMLTKDGNRNAEFVDDADLTALVKKQQVELDESKRLQEVYDVQRAHADKMYYPPIIYTKAYSFQQPWVQNFFVVDNYNFGTEQYANMSVNNK